MEWKQLQTGMRKVHDQIDQPRRDGSGVDELLDLLISARAIFLQYPADVVHRLVGSRGAKEVPFGPTILHYRLRSRKARDSFLWIGDDSRLARVICAQIDAVTVSRSQGFKGSIGVPSRRRR